MKWISIFTIFFGLQLCANEVRMEGMSKIPSGEYTPMYAEKNKKTRVPSFWMDSNPVTKKEFLDFVKTHSQWRRSKIKSIFAEKTYLKSWRSDLSVGFKGELSSPVVQVSWFAAQAFCESKNKSLPTVDQWEYVYAEELKSEDNRNRLMEWTLDFNTAMVTGESRGDSAIEKNLFCGSGSLGSSDFKNYSAFMRFAYRSSLKANYTTENLGFRCVKNED
jgi:formylglycine-generating enzyme required for sulfatase activity